MPDISMCNNKSCSLSWNCWRFNAPPKDIQDYADFKQDDNGKCDHYWDMDEIRESLKNIEL